jgi:hypothetical protein
MFLFFLQPFRLFQSPISSPAAAAAGVVVVVVLVFVLVLVLGLVVVVLVLVVVVVDGFCVHNLSPLTRSPLRWPGSADNLRMCPSKYLLQHRNSYFFIAFQHISIRSPCSKMVWL